MLVCVIKYSVMYTANDPQDQQDDDGDGEPEKNSQWNWLLWVPWIYVAWILYTNSNKEPPIPEVYFPSFIKHMLMTGEVSTKVYSVSTV